MPVPCRVAGRAVAWGGRAGCPALLGDADSRVSVLQVREILLQASQQGPEAELPTAPRPGEQPPLPTKAPCWGRAGPPHTHTAPVSGTG